MLVPLGFSVTGRTQTGFRIDAGHSADRVQSGAPRIAARSQSRRGARLRAALESPRRVRPAQRSGADRPFDPPLPAAHQSGKDRRVFSVFRLLRASHWSLAGSPIRIHRNS